MTDNKVASTPTLTRCRLASAIKLQTPDFPAEIIQVAARIILDKLASALEEDRPVALRGFGSFKVRRYENSPKKLGLIFRPSPELLTRINLRLKTAEKQ